MQQKGSIALGWSHEGWEDYLHWQKYDRKMLERINELIKDCRRHPFEGIGKPEPLRFQLKGLWSRRISQEHRLVYELRGEGEKAVLIIHQCRFHY
ncbi:MULTISPECIES: Txe/YoeB family addiction module toxin [Rhizobium/Agrobacterium group]|uniref:Txe/YoeB family addiction module toxin n=1 Tax=Rhizobium/Agrobacterium group TaxID=227290 RepID=UPI001AEDF7E7|nr:MULTISPECIES: Txe/YoeB family addiction module toxin [Rhizobium/Agrobacterium group]MCZ7471345.1 Txe/YoeB family addiction module toxin [Rhizobium rhizogenes]MCZ7480222.1 Txe/YoeB family addiction module toxin [Rhizobium rhizogenes]MCZ7486620.1 Txe/YoeB family addiction module toxin [Rhizobium rhizogenes]MDA5634151.1 Txe/YoeB family addiction module toxin [Agrobacterium sp. ST15.16.024]MDF1889667.1 Txe/YoeB family addiction module toxin [Rhizobium rhizogenes]